MSERIHRASHSHAHAMERSSMSYNKETTPDKKANLRRNALRVAKGVVTELCSKPLQARKDNTLSPFTVLRSIKAAMLVTSCWR